MKVVHRPDGEVLGAEIVAARAGEIVHELSLAIDQRIKLGELASSIHVYRPTRSGCSSSPQSCGWSPWPRALQ